MYNMVTNEHVGSAVLLYNSIESLRNAAKYQSNRWFRFLHYVDERNLSQPLYCFKCNVSKYIGWVFQQLDQEHFICISCTQGG